MVEYSVIKLSLIFLLTVSLRFIEQCREVISSLKKEKVLPDINVFYKILYLHLAMSMAAIGLICDKISSIKENIMIAFALIFIFILTTIGCIFRGILSQKSPEVYSLFDRDWLLGVIVPNALGLSSLIFALIK